LNAQDLREVTDKDLQICGVSKLGQRKRILRTLKLLPGQRKSGSRESQVSGVTGEEKTAHATQEGMPRILVKVDVCLNSHAFSKNVLRSSAGQSAFYAVTSGLVAQLNTATAARYNPKHHLSSSSSPSTLSSSPPPSLAGMLDNPVNLEGEHEARVRNRLLKGTEKVDVRALYESLRPTPNWSKEASEPPELQVSLLPYQRKALAWAIAREVECKGRWLQNDLWMHVPEPEGRPPDGCQATPLWYLRWGGLLCEKLPKEYMETSSIEADSSDKVSASKASRGPSSVEEPVKIRDISGGILAEEMGLGKTVEMIALVLKNQREEMSREEKFKIMIDDWPEDREKPLYPLRTTLIVTPIGILHQWANEINRHAPELKVYIYYGPEGRNLKKEGGAYQDLQDLERMSSDAPTFDANDDDDIDAAADDDDAADDEDEVKVKQKGVEAGREKMLRKIGGHSHPFEHYDIVLTTYRVLSSEVNYGKISQYTFRRRKRYKIPSTPLLTGRFWRMVLDEAQEVESPVRQSAQMADRIESVHRWCVTGTPIGKNQLEDLCGLFLFLRLYPFDSNDCWRASMSLPFLEGYEAPLKNLLSALAPF